MSCLWVRRPDLISTPHEDGGWVVKDPITLQFALLSDAEFFVLNLLDGQKSFSRILTLAAGQFSSERLTSEHLASFLKQLAGSQLIRTSAPGDSDRLQNPRRSPSRRILNALFSVLRIQWRLLNPQPYLDRVLPWCSLLNRRLVISLLSLLLIAAAAVVLTQTRRIAAEIPSVSEFAGPQHLFALLLIYVVVKVIHELGHALTARYFRAECHECGILLMVFTPVLYTNVTDTWRLNRRQRMLVTAAGIGVELLVAAACIVLWSAAAPGLTRSMLLNTALLCSLNTVLFNGNPLLRFDGYFLLSDAVRIPNLAGRSAALLQNSIVKLLTGAAGRRDPGSPAERRFMLAYGILAGVYRLLLTIAILQLVDHVSRMWQLRIAGQLLSLVVLSGLLVLPTWNLFRKIRMAAGQRTAGQKMLMRGRIVIVLAALILLLNVPFSHSVVAPASVQPTATAVYASVPGRLDQFVRYGSQVEAGQCLVSLQNEELLQKRARLTADLRRLQTELSALRDNPATANAALIPTLRESVDAAASRLDAFESELAELCVRVPAGGQFFPPPHKPPAMDSDLPQHWSGVPAAGINQGAWIERGSLLGYVGRSTDLELHVPLTEDKVELVRAGQALRFSRPGTAQHVRGRIHTVSDVPTTAPPSNLLAAGLIAGPAEVTYLATIRLQSGSELPPPLYAVGRVRIQTEATSLLQRVVRYLRQTF